MPEKALEYPQLPESLLDLWLNLPATRIMLQCMHWRIEESIEYSGTGQLVDTSNADLTHGLIHRELGKQDAYSDAANPRKLLEYYDMLEKPEESEND